MRRYEEANRAEIARYLAAETAAARLQVPQQARAVFPARSVAVG